MKYTYAGIGARKTPKHILETMTCVAEFLAGNGDCVLRSGGADGADSAFEAGCDLVEGPKRIYLPWLKYNGNSSDLYRPTDEAFEIAKGWHPNWAACSQAVKKLHARNSQIILGDDCDAPADFVICYTPFGEGGGGTGQALRLAKAHNIPVFDLGHTGSADNHKRALWEFIRQQLGLNMHT